MKVQIRHNVFETNSSSVHTLTITEQDTMDKWQNGEVVYDDWEEKFVSSDLEEVKKYFELKHIVDGETDATDEEIENATLELDDFGYGNYISWEDFKNDTWCDEDYETYHETYTTKHGDTIHVFGYYSN